jgi:gliding motility-associated-like protein
MYSTYLPCYAQNLVRNPNFTELDTCPYSYDQVHFANHWTSGNDQSPDLYHTCGTSFFSLPQIYSCIDLNYNIDDGFVGIVTYGQLPNFQGIREKIIAPLISEPPKESDIFCALSVLPRPLCPVEGNPSNACYTDGLSMNIVYENETLMPIIEAESIINNTDTWRRLHGCYNPIGNEKKISIYNRKANSQTEIECDIIDPSQNVSYIFIDNVIIAPFEILPPSLVICDTEENQFLGLNFYNLPLSWEDGVDGGERTFKQSGTYTLIADAGTCLLEETISITVLKEYERDTVELVTKCEETSIDLVINLPGNIIWSTGENGKSINVPNQGEYSATITTPCKEITLDYLIEDLDCNKIITSANVFSPNKDGINDEITFFLNPQLSINGTLHIYDRWGNEIYSSSSRTDFVWNGESSDSKLLQPGVYVWVFISDNGEIMQYGDVTIVK